MIIKEVIKDILGPSTVFKFHQWKQEKTKPCVSAMLAKNIEFNNNHKGERCFVFGNGPSIKNVDFSLFTHEYVFTVNQMSRFDKFEQLKTNFHFWSDERFFDLREDRTGDMEILKYMKAVNTGENSPIVFYKVAASTMIKKYGLDKILNIRYYDDISSVFPDKSFSFDFTKVIPHFQTVVHYAILLAVYMGFEEIYLLGCDCTGILNVIQSRLKTQGETAYAYTISDAERKRMQRTNAIFPIQDEIRAAATIFDDYEWIRDYCVRHGVKIYNATNPTLLDSIEKVNLKDVLMK